MKANNTKIIIGAYAVSPVRGSECAVGWEICRRLGSYYDITVLMANETPSQNKFFQEVQAHLASNPDEAKNVTFIPISHPPLSRLWTFIHDHGFWPAYYLAYNLWQRAAFRKAMDLHKKTPFSLAHQMNMIGYREPGYLWKLSIPFVWGPVGGFPEIPWGFIRHSGLKNIATQGLKKLANAAQQRSTYRCKQAAKHADHIWTVEHNGQALIRELWGSPSEIMLEAGAYPLGAFTVSPYNSSRPLHLAWSGMITFGKQLPLLLRALHKLKNANFILTVIGDGYEKDNCIKLSSELSIGEKIRWVGWVSHAKAVELVKACDVFIHTSVKEATSTAVLEALSLGKPVICHDACGMGIAITENCGRKVPLISPDISIADFCRHIESLIGSPDLVAQLSRGAWERASELSWDRTVETIAKVYDCILTGKKRVGRYMGDLHKF
jgi:glycosyltransferase involved in cell wall biosynthesis